jgi:hypothetical protein
MDGWSEAPESEAPSAPPQLPPVASSSSSTTTHRGTAHRAVEPLIAPSPLAPATAHQTTDSVRRERALLLRGAGGGAEGASLHVRGGVVSAQHLMSECLRTHSRREGCALLFSISVGVLGKRRAQVRE